jgi:Ergosterol biosynthesis ERG4/ERG24 family
VPEITAAFLWTVPGGFTHLLPYFYVVFLTLLLTVRHSKLPAIQLTKCCWLVCTSDALLLMLSDLNIRV